MRLFCRQPISAAPKFFHLEQQTKVSSVRSLTECARFSVAASAHELRTGQLMRLFDFRAGKSIHCVGKELMSFAVATMKT